MPKRLFVIIVIMILILSFLIGVIISKHMETVRNSNEITNNTDQETNIQKKDQESIVYINSSKKYYLHKSDLEEPSNEVCKNLQKKALDGLNETEVKNVQKLLRETHVMLEYRLIDAVRLIKEPDSPYWTKFNIDAVYKDPSSGNMVKSDGFYNNVEDLKKLEDMIKEAQTKEKIKEIYSQLQEAMDKHDLEGCFKVHEIIHDYDYWCINYPAYFATFPPADWGGINTYFGTI